MCIHRVFQLLMKEKSKKIWLMKSSPIVKFRLNDLSPLFLGLLMEHFFIHDRDHFAGFCIIWYPPVFLCTIISFLDRFSLICSIFLISLYTDISVTPITFVFFTFISKSTVFVRLSLWVHRFVMGMSTHISFEISDLFLVVIIIVLKFMKFLLNRRVLFFGFLR